MRPLPLLLCAALLLAPALAPPMAAAGAPAVLIEEHVIEGPFWIAWRVDVTQADATFRFELAAPESQEREQVGYGLWIVRVDGSDKPYHIIGAGGDQMTEAHVDQVEPVPHRLDVGPLARKSGQTNGFSMSWEDAPLGEYWLVIVNTSPWATRATARLEASAGVELVASTRGVEGGLLRDTDFETDEPYRHVRVGAQGVTAQTHSMRNATAAVTVEHSLFGLFAARGGEERDISRVRPSGEEVRPAVVPSLPMSAEPAGPHLFKVNAWEVAPRAALGDAHVVLLWADLELP